MASPGASVISKSSGFAPPGNAQLNLCKRLANVISITEEANVVPGQPLLPAPKGMNWKSFPLKSIALSKNLSGLNSSGFSHDEGSLPIAQALMITLVLARIS
jgi:hypothetical protein